MIHCSSYLSVNKTAELLHCSPKTIRSYIKDGFLKHKSLSSRKTLVNVQDFFDMDLVKVSEAAKFFDVSVSTIYRYIENETLESKVIGNVTLVNLKNFREERKVGNE